MEFCNGYVWEQLRRASRDYPMCTPPDIQLAVSSKHAVETVNTEAAIYTDERQSNKENVKGVCMPLCCNIFI